MEHVSKEEGTPKEGYLTELSAKEAMHVMEYKYKEPFKVYRCKVCQKWHIGRINMVLMKLDDLKKQIKEQDEYCRKNNTPEGLGCEGCPGEGDKICADALMNLYGHLPHD